MGRSVSGARLAPPAELGERCAHEPPCEQRLEPYRRRLRALALELSLTAERERREIAQGLHDDIGQSLALVRLKIEALRRAAPDGTGTADLDELLEVLGDTIRSTRRLTFELSPPLLYELGLEAALRCLAERMRTKHGVVCRLDCDEEPKPLDTDVATVVHGVVRELLHNVVKHARAANVRIVLVRGAGRLRVEVADDGCGFRVPRGDDPWACGDGFGLFSARERVLESDGTMEIVSAPGNGTRVLLTVPLAVERDVGG